MLIGVLATYLRPRYFKQQREVLLANSEYERNFSQLVDHFTPSSTETFENRYFINDRFYVRGVSEVLVIDVGGEAANSETSVTGKYSSYYFAEQIGGLLVSLEHRFYGTSNPERSQQDLQFLSAEQAIADYADFIAYIKAQYNLTKVLAVGGSYSASLAAWMRAQIPHMVDAALVSSGPLLAEQNFTRYLQHVQMQFSEQAQAVLRQMYQYISQRIAENDCADICAIFGVANCNFESDLDKITFAEALVDPLAGVVQYSKAALWDGVQAFSDVEVLDKQLVSSASVDDTMRILSQYADLSAFQHYDEIIDAFQRSGQDEGRLWYYQTCREFGFYQTAQFDGSIFPQIIDLDYFLAICLDAYYQPMGLIATRDLEQARKLHQQVIAASNFQHFGALNAPRDHIYYTAGAVDPWTELAMSDDLDWEHGKFRHLDTRVEVIEEGSHCSDLYMTWTSNAAVRERQLESFKKWLEVE